MSSFIKKINRELTQKILETKNINVVLKDFSLKQYLDFLHSMDLGDIFFYPDLQCLIDYEKELDGRN
ncbi:MAG: hypothetical protein PHQ62_00145 [Clostridia bacterium]|nr:hypothetical protein [Clostridia bacterium]